MDLNSYNFAAQNTFILAASGTSILIQVDDRE